jgi:glc operon protein GlcG
MSMRSSFARTLLTAALWTGAGALAAGAALPRAAGAQLRAVRAISADGAQRALAAAAAEARRQKWAVSIAVVDPGGELVAFLRLDGAPYGSVDVAPAKARTAARFRRPTRALDSTITAGRTAILGLPGVTPVEGGVPIVIGGEVVGAVGVSGVASSEDARVARAGAAAVQP